MGQFVVENPDSPAERRSRAVRTFLFAIALTPLLLFIDPVLAVVTPTVTGVAVGGGLVLGAGVSLWADRYRLGGENDVAVSAAVLVVLAVATVALWLALPSEYFPAVTQFTLAFVWGVSLTSIARYVVLPRLSGGKPQEN